VSLVRSGPGGGGEIRVWSTDRWAGDIVAAGGDRGVNALAALRVAGTVEHGPLVGVVALRGARQPAAKRCPCRNSATSRAGRPVTALTVSSATSTAWSANRS